MINQANYKALKNYREHLTTSFSKLAEKNESEETMGTLSGLIESFGHNAQTFQLQVGDYSFELSGRISLSTIDARTNCPYVDFTTYRVFQPIDGMDEKYRDIHIDMRMVYNPKAGENASKVTYFINNGKLAYTPQDALLEYCHAIHNYIVRVEKGLTIEMV